MSVNINFNSIGSWISNVIEREASKEKNIDSSYGKMVHLIQNTSTIEEYELVCDLVKKLKEKEYFIAANRPSKHANESVKKIVELERLLIAQVPVVVFSEEEERVFEENLLGLSTENEEESYSAGSNKEFGDVEVMAPVRAIMDEGFTETVSAQMAESELLNDSETSEDAEDMERVMRELGRLGAGSEAPINDILNEPTDFALSNRVYNKNKFHEDYRTNIFKDDVDMSNTDDYLINNPLSAPRFISED